MISSIGLIGGTGDLGTALALHFAKKCNVLIGSRSKERAESIVQTIISEKGNREYLKRNLKAASNQEVASSCETTVATVPHETAVDTIRNLVPYFRGDQLLISAAAPLYKIGDEFHPKESHNAVSITKSIRQILPESIEVATAFQTVPANILYKEKEISSDVPVACNSRETFQKAAELITLVEGLRPLYVGSLELSEYIEGLTALLLDISIKNKLRSPTLKFNSF